MTKRVPIPQDLKRKLYQESKSKCPICGESDTITHQIHHITPVKDGGGNNIENLIMLCANCHSKVERGEIKKAEIITIKRKLMKGLRTINSDSVPKSISLVNSKNIGNIGNIANDMIINNNFTNSKPTIEPAKGSIASDVYTRNYIQHLINRFKDFQRSHKERGDWKYGIIQKAIRKKYKANWQHIPIENFQDLTQFIQERIDKTIIGKSNKRKGIKNYSSFEDFNKK